MNARKELPVVYTVSLLGHRKAFWGGEARGRQGREELGRGGWNEGRIWPRTGMAAVVAALSPEIETDMGPICCAYKLML